MQTFNIYMFNKRCICWLKKSNFKCIDQLRNYYISEERLHFMELANDTVPPELILCCQMRWVEDIQGWLV